MKKKFFPKPININGNVFRSKAEHIFYEILRERGYSPLVNQKIGKYSPDFLFPEIKLIIEIDGSQHRSNRVHDYKRDRWLISQGYTVIRFCWDELYDPKVPFSEKIGYQTDPKLSGNGGTKKLTLIGKLTKKFLTLIGVKWKKLEVTPPINYSKNYPKIDRLIKKELIEPILKPILKASKIGFTSYLKSIFSFS